VKGRNTEIIISLAYVVLIFFCRGVYIYYDKDLNAFEAFRETILELGNLLIIILPGMFLAFVILLFSRRMKK
jgi:hypothetical protein